MKQHDLPLILIEWCDECFQIVSRRFMRIHPVEEIPLFLGIDRDGLMVLAIVIECQVFGDLHDPGVEIASRFVLVEMREHLHIGFLHQIFGVASVSDDGDDDGEDAAFRLVINFLESDFVSLTKQREPAIEIEQGNHLISMTIIP